MKNRYLRFFLPAFVLLFSDLSMAGEVCPSGLVKMWTDYAERHGSSSVPTFLIENQCLDRTVGMTDNYRDIHIRAELQKEALYNKGVAYDKNNSMALLLMVVTGILFSIRIYRKPDSPEASHRVKI